MIRGQTFQIRSTVYIDEALSRVASLVGGSVRTMFKVNPTDEDSDALFTVVATGLSVDGTCLSSLSAAQSNSIFTSIIFYETVAKLVDGVTYIRSGIVKEPVEGNVIKTLF